MGRAWAEHPSWEIVAEASEVAGRDVAHLLIDAPMEELTVTSNAQLATLVQSLVVLDAVERLGLAPSACAGHSLGEYTALVATGAISFEDGVRLVLARGEAMHQAGEDAPGTMAAVLGLADADAEAACVRAEGDVWVANYNAPGQVVIAGTSDAVATASAMAKELGARRILPIPVSGAFHTPLLRAARPALRKAVDQARFRAPEVPVVANVDARVHDAPQEWPGLLSAQLCSPVRWRQSVEALAGLGVTTLVELGPGGVLSGLARRAAPELKALAVAEPDHLDALMDAVAASDHGPPAGHRHGEHLYVTERVVVSPSAGIFQPEQDIAAPGIGLIPGTGGAGGPGATGSTVGTGTTAGRGDAGAPGPAAPATVEVGALVGRVGVAEVRTPFAGTVVRWLAQAGDRVQIGQPLVWLTATGDPAEGR